MLLSDSRNNLMETRYKMIKFERNDGYVHLPVMHLRSIRRFFFGVTILFCLPAAISAQKISMEETLAYVNGKLGSGYEVDVNRGIIIARFSEGVEVYREDQVLYKTLDLSSMKYDSEQKMFIINCKDGKKCVDRQLHIKKIQRDYHRISFPVNLDAKGIEGMKNAFRHMYQLIEDPKNENSEPFE